MRSEVQNAAKRMLALVGVLKRMPPRPPRKPTQVLHACTEKLWVGHTKSWQLLGNESRLGEEGALRTYIPGTV